MSGAAPAGDHLSIGEVLAALHDEFPDITISKIRFLESQGLIDPERTPSGYRKFYPDDVTRLRWILFQQKEHFLPLKVIKERLDELGPADLSVLEPADTPGAEEAEHAGADALVSPVEVPVTPPALSTSPTPGAAGSAAGSRRRTPSRTRPPAFAPRLPGDDDVDDAQITAPTGDIEQLYSRDALCAAAGLDAAQLASLEQYGLVTPAREAGDDVQFDADAVQIATISGAFFSRGVEARHLRMYHTFAEREAALFGQVLMPYQRQRNPESRARLQSELVELATLGRRLRMVLLREAVRENLSE
ncbi:MAG TPA: MerR family transcriptional regulator [Acidimicrobiia bacterium]|nr:MerR family transcriptional regulator [Acidimicrobiia bacterium]